MIPIKAIMSSSLILDVETQVCEAHISLPLLARESIVPHHSMQDEAIYTKAKGERYCIC